MKLGNKHYPGLPIKETLKVLKAMDEPERETFPITEVAKRLFPILNLSPEKTLAVTITVMSVLSDPEYEITEEWYWFEDEKGDTYRLTTEQIWMASQEGVLHHPKTGEPQGDYREMVSLIHTRGKLWTNVLDSLSD